MAQDVGINTNQSREQRLRDPVHGLVVFAPGEQFEQLMWRLINTPEFQRLRRIKQLGFSELVYPGATHTRFAHSIGVFHTARLLVRQLRQLLGTAFSEERANIATCAALLHDVGHGPFSHAFEAVMKERGTPKKHEAWTVDIIEGDTPTGRILDGFNTQLRKQVAELLRQKHPSDIYASIVSSQFDADRLDYLRRDRLMTGTEHGSFDWAWLLNNLQIGEIPICRDQEKEWSRVDGLILSEKGLSAAEAYLLGRYHLYTQVYLHKTTRAAEKMLGKLLGRVAQCIAERKENKTGLPKQHPLRIFFGKKGDTLENYLKLDDSLLWGSMSFLSSAEDEIIRELAERLQKRDLYKCVNISSLAKASGGAALGKFSLSLQEAITSKSISDIDVLLDRTNVSAYELSDYESPTVLEQIRIQRPGAAHEDIAVLSEVVAPLCKEEKIFRVYGRDPKNISVLRDLWKEASK